MQVQVPESVQVDFHLRVRKVGLALVSMKELDTLMKVMVLDMSNIIDRGYLVSLQTTLDGVTMSTNT